MQTLNPEFIQIPFVALGVIQFAIGKALTKKMKVLIVEDEVALSDTLAEFLRGEGHVCELASTFREGSEKIELYQYDILVLDLGLPDGNGIDLIRELKKANPGTGILILTARDSLQDKVKGLELGADDYLAKPFHMPEFYARLRAIFRRRFTRGHENLICGQIEVLLDEKSVLVNQEKLDLTKKEFELLVFLLTNLNRVLSKESIAEHLWGDAIDSSDSFDFVYSHVKNIRKKITEKGGTDCIKTVYGLGYKYSTV